MIMQTRREVMGSLLEQAGLRVVFKRFTDYDEQQDCVRRAAVSQQRFVPVILLHPELPRVLSTRLELFGQIFFSYHGQLDLASSQ
jgi:hypothetical protein